MMDFLTARLPVKHGFFTRKGGVSIGPYESLNCSVSGADDADAVRQNRALVANAMGVAAGDLLGLKQVHGTAVKHVVERWAAGAGEVADAMVTTMPGIALGIVTADCAPVLLADAARRVIGAVHAGWRGAVAGVLDATVDAMRGLMASDLHAAIGPCIHQASYEVGVDLRAAVLAREVADARFFVDGGPGRWRFDLPGYCAARLAAVGVSVEILDADTCAREGEFFSHRRRVLRGELAIGHQISVIRI